MNKITEVILAKAGGILVIFLLLTGSTQTASPQEVRAQGELGSVISVNVLGFPLGVVNAQYEKMWKPNVSLVGQVVFDSETREGYWGDWECTRFGGSIGIKRYLKPTAPLGPWYGGNLSLQYVSAEYRSTWWTDKDSSLLFGLAGVWGYKWLFGRRFTAELALGLLFSFGSVWAGGERFSLTPVGAAVGLNLGYAF